MTEIRDFGRDGQPADLERDGHVALLLEDVKLMVGNAEQFLRRRGVEPDGDKYHDCLKKALAAREDISMVNWSEFQWPLRYVDETLSSDERQAFANLVGAPQSPAIDDKAVAKMWADRLPYRVEIMTYNAILCINDGRHFIEEIRKLLSAGHRSLTFEIAALMAQDFAELHRRTHILTVGYVKESGYRAKQGGNRKIFERSNRDRVKMVALTLLNGG